MKNVNYVKLIYIFQKKKYCGITCENIYNLLNTHTQFKISWHTTSIIISTRE